MCHIKNLENVEHQDTEKYGKLIQKEEINITDNLWSPDLGTIDIWLPFSILFPLPPTYIQQHFDNASFHFWGGLFLCFPTPKTASLPANRAVHYSVQLSPVFGQERYLFSILHPGNGAGAMDSESNTGEWKSWLLTLTRVKVK